MNVYSAGALLKIIVGVAIMTILYNYINIYQDPAIGLSFGFLGVFMVVWGASYFVFLWLYKLFSTQPTYMHTSLSYKLSLMIGIYVMINITLIITDHWNKLIGITILVIFIIIQALFFSHKNKEPQYFN